MKKIAFFFCLSLLLSCSNDKKAPKKADIKPTVITRYDNNLVIAFYFQDSLKERFNYFKKEDQNITQKQKLFQVEVENRTRALQEFVKRNEEKVQKGLLSQNEIAEIQQKAQKMEQELMQYQQTEGGRLEEESLKKTEALNKKIEALGKLYCEKNNIDILLIHGIGGQINFISNKMNVTSDFIRYLNENQATIEKDLK